MKMGIGSVRQVSGTFDKSEEYNMDLQREFGALNIEIDMEETNKNRVDYDVEYPWEGSSNKFNKSQLEKEETNGNHYSCHQVLLCKLEE